MLILRIIIYVILCCASGFLLARCWHEKKIKREEEREECEKLLAEPPEEPKISLYYVVYREDVEVYRTENGAIAEEVFNRVIFENNDKCITLKTMMRFEE